MLEPGNPYIHGWHIDVVCAHLEAISRGDDEDGFNRLLINIPPGTMKSMLVSVFWCAWEWTTRPHLRFICASHSLDISIRDSMRCRRLVMSDWYQARWGKTVKLTDDQNAKTKFENSAGGFRQAAAAGSITGARGDRVIIDDPHSVDGALSDATRESTVQWFLEAVPTRVNDPERSAIVVIMQRLHEADVAGTILQKDLGYEHLCLPMRFEEGRRCETSIGFVDERADGELLFPERFPEHVVERDERAMGPFAVAGQFQQRPEPRGGGILKREWWEDYDEDAAKFFGLNIPQGSRMPLAYPPMELIVASLDPAYTEKEENDPSALTIWGLCRDAAENPMLILMNAWAKRLELHGPLMEREPGENERAYLERTQPDWGLIEWLFHSCKRFKVDHLLIEGKASGLSVFQEMKRLNRYADWSLTVIDPGKEDKVARAYSVQPFFANGQVFAPKSRLWADEVISEAAVFPKGKHDDRVDSLTMAIRWFRAQGLLERPDEISGRLTAELMHVSPIKPVYDA